MALFSQCTRLKCSLPGVCIALSLLLLWQAFIFIFHLPSYILPSPWQVFNTLYQQAPLFIEQTWPTLWETLSGLLLAILLGVIVAIAMSAFRLIRWWLLPLLIISQAIPTFAIAPLLVIWFGYGMASKIITTTLMLFFPIASAFFDGLRRTPVAWLDLAKTLHASSLRTLWFIRIPAAIPSLVSGIRVATVMAPLGAIIGEWVGASRGLGFLMLNANARLQIDVMFACIAIIMVWALLLYASVNHILLLCFSINDVQSEMNSN